MNETGSLINSLITADAPFPWELLEPDEVVALREKMGAYQGTTSGLGSASPWCEVSEARAGQLSQAMISSGLFQLQRA